MKKSSTQQLYEMTNSYTLKRFKMLVEGAAIAAAPEMLGAAGGELGALSAIVPALGNLGGGNNNDSNGNNNGSNITINNNTNESSNSAIDKLGLSDIFEACCESDNKIDKYIQKLKDPVDKALERLLSKKPKKAKQFAEIIKSANKKGNNYLKIALVATIMAANAINASANQLISSSDNNDIPQNMANLALTTNSEDMATLYDVAAQVHEVQDKNKKNTIAIYSNYKENPNQLKDTQSVIDFAASSNVAKDFDKSDMKIIKIIPYKTDNGIERVFIV